MKIIFIFSCSGMFRNVPACSGMFHVPGFINARYGHIRVIDITITVDFTLLYCAALRSLLAN